MYDCYEMRINDLILKGDYLLQRNNIVGIGLGNKIINGKWTNVPSLTVVVKKKVSQSALNSRDVIPKYMKGILTDVIEGGEVKACDARVRPAYGGVSIGIENDKVNTRSYGTIAYAVTDRETKSKIYILSCLHVFTANFNTSIKGSIVQPALVFDKDNVKNNIAKITKIVPLDSLAMDDLNMNEVDAAIAIVGRNVEVTFKNFIVPKLRDGTIIKKIDKVDKGDSIWKIGAETGKTYGKIIIKNFKTEMTFEKQKLYFKNQIVADCSIESGDSGALGVVTRGMVIKERKAFGMLMGGMGEFAIFNPIDKVLDYLDVDLLVR